MSWGGPSTHSLLWQGAVFWLHYQCPVSCCLNYLMTWGKLNSQRAVMCSGWRMSTLWPAPCLSESTGEGFLMRTAPRCLTAADTRSAASRAAAWLCNGRKVPRSRRWRSRCSVTQVHRFFSQALLQCLSDSCGQVTWNPRELSPISFQNVLFFVSCLRVRDFFFSFSPCRPLSGLGVF